MDVAVGRDVYSYVPDSEPILRVLESKEKFSYQNSGLTISLFLSFIDG